MRKVVGPTPGRRGESATPTRGREVELTALHEAVAGLVEGLPGLVLIEGGAGLGKSQLLTEVAAEARRCGVRVSVGAADPCDREGRYGPLLTALASGDAPVLDAAAVASLRELREQRYWFVIELEAAIERAATAGGLVVALDDAHWADSSTMDTIRNLAGHLGSPPILWVLAYRPRHDSRALSQFVAELDTARTTRIVVEPLSDDAMREVIVDHLGHGVEDALFELARQTDGVPFFLVDLLRNVSVDDAGQLQYPKSGKPTDGLAERLTALTAAARQVADVGSVLGRTFRSEDVAAMLTVGVPTLMDAFTELVRADVLVESGEVWAFRHDIVRQAVLGSIADPLRQSLEREAASVLLAAGIPPVDIAGRLAAVAAPGDHRAIHTIVEAARSLLGTDPGTAADLNLRALQLIAIGSPLRATIAAETVIALHLAGRETDALRLADESLADMCDGDQYGELQLSVARIYTLPATTRAECGRRGLSAPGLSDVLRARHLAVLALSEAASGATSDAEATARAAEELIVSCGDAVAELQLQFSRMTLDAAVHRYGDALARVPTIRRLVGETGDQVPGMGADWLRANVMVSLDQFDNAWSISEEARRMAHRYRQAWLLPIWDMWQGWFLLQRGRLSEARALLEGVLVTDGAPVATALSDASGVAALGKTARHLGDRRLVTWCTNVAVQTLALNTDDDARRHLGWFLAFQAAADARLADLTWALARGCHGGRTLPGLARDVGMEVDVARMMRDIGQYELAARAVDDAEARAGLNEGCESLAAAALHARGLVEGSTELIRRAAESHGAGSRLLLGSSAFEDLGVARIGEGDVSGAVNAFGAALELATVVGAEWDARRLRSRLRRLGVRRRIAKQRRAASGWGSLTPAELAVARLIGSGISNRDAAEMLYVSGNTISAHLRHIFEKLGIRSRVELARIVADRERAASRD